MFDTTGNVLGRMDYGPFGQELIASSGNQKNIYGQLFRDSESELDNAQARMYQARTGRFTRVDSVYTGLLEPQRWNRYAYSLNNPVTYSDPDGLNAQNGLPTFRTETFGDRSFFIEMELWWYLGGGGGGWSGAYDSDGGRGRGAGGSPGPSNIGDNSTPVEVGLEWLTGLGPPVRDFRDGDPFTEELKDSRHIKSLRDKVASDCTSQTNVRYDNDLSGIAGVPKYLGDYSTVMTLGYTGNLAATYLGSYRLQYSTTRQSGSVSMSVHVSNSSTIASATHPPVIGYTQLWDRYIGEPLNRLLSSGPMSEKKQNFDWTEVVACK